MGAFPKNLGRNFVGVFSGQNLLPFAVGVAATTYGLGVRLPDEGPPPGRLPDLRDDGSHGRRGGAIVPIVGALFVAGRFAPQGRFRAVTYDFAQAMIVNGAYTGILKYSVQRPRPDGSDNLSFPSGHTSTAFSLAAVANHHYGWKVGIPAYVAGLVHRALAHRVEQAQPERRAGGRHDRPHRGAHGGPARRRAAGEEEHRSAVGPATDPHGQGVGLGLSASW